MFFPYPSVWQLHLDQGCISQMFILRQYSSGNGSLVSLTSNNFNFQHINFNCLCDQLLVHNSLQCLWVIHLEGTKYQHNCQYSVSLSWFETYVILPLGGLLSVGAVFIICSETKDYYNFIGNMSMSKDVADPLRADEKFVIPNFLYVIITL